MSRPSVTIPFNPNKLKAEIVRRGWTLEMVGEFFGISRQAVNSWFVAERIPPRRMSDLVQKLDINADTTATILDWRDSPKDLMRENIKLREDIDKLKSAISALIGELP